MNVMIENSVKAIIIQDKKILMLRNKSIFDIGEWYSLPGGRQKPEESFADAIVREVAEETALSVEMGELLFVREYIHRNHEFAEQGKPSHKIEFMFRCRVKNDFSLEIHSELDEEQIGLYWMPMTELETANVIPRKLRRISASGLPSSCEYWGDILFEEN